VNVDRAQLVVMQVLRDNLSEEGRYEASWNSEFQLPWGKAGLLRHLDDVVDSDQ